MGFMSKEEIIELRKNTGLVDAGATKRTCITCNFQNECQHVMFALHKIPESECDFWHPGLMTCGLCKHSALFPNIRFSLYCTHDSDTDEKLKVDYNQNRCAYWELPEELERFC